jgi:hypothetical protein
MKRTFHKWFIGLQIGSVMLTGCQPTQPFYLRDRANFAEYLQHAQQIEIPDLEIDPVPEASHAFEPLTLDNQKYEFLDLTLEECVSYALVNS